MANRSLGLLGRDAGRERLTKVLGGALVVSLLVVVGLSIAPNGSGSTTEFYVLGPDGTASGYPENVTTGETATLQVGIGNFESGPRTYTVVVRTAETEFVTETVTVNAEKRWEEPVSVSFETTGRKRLVLELYSGESTDGEPSHDLQLFVDVRPS